MKITDEKTGVLKELKPALVLFIILWFITGVAYPLAAYAAGQLMFPAQAAGSLIYDKNGAVSGSELIGQQFSGRRYFWPRPSATADYPYNPLASGGSNLGPTSRKLHSDIASRRAYLMAANNVSEIPSDMVMASASGLDPHISPESARMQAQRVASARGIGLSTVNKLIEAHTEKPVLGILGEERVNVLMLNKALDELP
jgi:K+-transporting ATPase ATPase C chain